MIDLSKICFQKTHIMGFSNHLPSILHLLAQHRAKDHPNIFDKRIIPIIIAIQPHFVWIDDCVVILYCYVLGIAGVAFLLLLGHKRLLNIRDFTLPLKEKLWILLNPFSSIIQ